MGSDDLFKKRQRERTKRKSKEKALRAETWLLVCEGTKTEPNYFKSLFKYANTKSEQKIRYKIEGTGTNTETLVNSIDGFYDFTDTLVRQANIPYGKVFAVFDKDSFKSEQFNNAIYAAQRRGYCVLWSNQCIELWFLLHFMYFDSDIIREDYFDKLGKILGSTYKKNNDHFEMLHSEQNLQTAVRNAEKLYKKFQNEGSFAKMAPCTTVFKLIKELENYMGIKL